ncbi:MAG: glycosyltransferase family 9 protein [Deltaproteobacteria bacterium]|nr:glycosyltransferase family 9 protein [Deltaproteobacteria bacterium]MBM4286869.1 glycosyltransferase family 9 protein [Deltaproteobacteria bacterium]
MNRLKLALCLRKGANLVLKKMTLLLFPRTRVILEKLRSQKGKILILRTGNIGDTACALPALAALRENFPSSHLCLLTSPGPQGLPEAHEVLEGLGLVDEIITFYQEDLAHWRFRRSLLRDLRRRGFHLFVLLPQERSSLSRNLRDLLFARLLGVKGALGFDLANAFPGFDLRTLKDYVPPHNEVERLLLLLGRAGINGIRPFILNLPASCHRLAEELLHPHRRDGRIIIGFQAFAKEQAKQWPLENFAELGRSLYEAYQPLFVLVGGPGDRERLQDLATRFPGDKLIAAGQATVLETAALLARCHVLVTLDTGPMHLAALVGTSIVALFSARQFPRMWDPHTDQGILLRALAPCDLCFQDNCAHLTCMQTIGVKEVENAVERILGMK